MTFRLHEDFLEQCPLPNPADSYARTGGWGRTIADLQPCAPVQFPSRWYVWVIYVDTPFNCTDRELGAGGAGVTIMHGDDLKGLSNDQGNTQCGHHRSQQSYVGGTAHELGHAFGLPHPPGCDDGLPECDSEALMWLGFDNYPDTYLTDADIATLRDSRFLQYTLPS